MRGRKETGENKKAPKSTWKVFSNSRETGEEEGGHERGGGGAGGGEQVHHSLSCSDNIQQSIILSVNAVGRFSFFFFFFSSNPPPPPSTLPPLFPFRVIVALVTMANLPFLKQMSHLVGN